MATTPTTAAAIRDRLIAVIVGLIPASDSQLLFREHTNELDGDFRRYARANPQGMTRVFQVKDDGKDGPPAVTNLDIDEDQITFEIVVAYAQDHRFGADAALARYAVIKQDQKQIERNVGLGGRENFTAPTYPDAYWVSSDVVREEDDGVDFLVITQTMRFRALV